MNLFRKILIFFLRKCFTCVCVSFLSVKSKCLKIFSSQRKKCLGNDAFKYCSASKTICPLYWLDLPYIGRSEFFQHQMVHFQVVKSLSVLWDALRWKLKFQDRILILRGDLLLVLIPCANNRTLL